MTHFSQAPFLLVGTKTDLRQDRDTLAQLADKSREPVTYAQGMAMARLKNACFP